MHCIFPLELLIKKGREEGVGTTFDVVEKKQKVQMSMDSEEEEEEKPLERKKRTLPMFLQLPEHAMLSGKDVNENLVFLFIGDVLVKKP
jgi:hypothetical protein